MAKLEIALAAVVGGLLSLPLGLAAAADTKAAPTCSAIAFRPLPSGLNDGVQNAGLYHSRFGRMEVKANVKNGTPEGYFVEIDGKPPVKVGGAGPAAGRRRLRQAEAHERTRRRARTRCSGDRLTVLTSHSGDKRYYLLYAHEGRGAEAWHFCSAGTA